MTLSRLLPAALVTLALLAPAASAQGKPGDYLTADGRLKHALVVTRFQGSITFANSTRLTIDPSGKWVSTTESTAFATTASAGGQLSKAQLATLARALARYDLRSLKHHGTRPPGRRRWVSIEFGKVDAFLIQAERDPIAAPSTTAMPGRFSGILKTVGELVAPQRDRKR
jgi:hypothetical protein